MSLDNFYLARPGADEVQLDLFGDYKSNIALYPAFQEYFRTRKPRFLAVWGKNDPFFLPPGAEAFKRDIPDAACASSIPAISRWRPTRTRSPTPSVASWRADDPNLFAPKEPRIQIRSRSPSSPVPARELAVLLPYDSRKDSNRGPRREPQISKRPRLRSPRCVPHHLSSILISRSVDPRNRSSSALSTFGRIDALVNVAGAVPQIDLFEMTDEQWDVGVRGWSLNSTAPGA